MRCELGILAGDDAGEDFETRSSGTKSRVDVALAVELMSILPWPQTRTGSS